MQLHVLTAVTAKLDLLTITLMLRYALYVVKCFFLYYECECVVRVNLHFILNTTLMNYDIMDSCVY